MQLPAHRVAAAHRLAVAPSVERVVALRSIEPEMRDWPQASGGRSTCSALRFEVWEEKPVKGHIAGTEAASDRRSRSVVVRATAPHGVQRQSTS
jgi:hypothetical protein